MSRRLKRALISALPVPSWRRALTLRWLTGREFFRSHFALPLDKKAWMERYRADVETLVLGSSHALYDYRAEGSAFNLADISSDFRRAHDLLAYWLDRGLPSLRHVILFYDVFSPGNVLERCSVSFRLIPYRRAYGFRTDACRRDTTMGVGYGTLDAVFRRQARRPRPCPASDYRGNIDWHLAGGMPDSVVDSRVAMHLKLNRGDECRYVAMIHGLLRTRGVRLTIVIPPLRDDYRQRLPVDRAVLTVPLMESVRGLDGVDIVDLIDNPAFTHSDFVDMDHLNAVGAEKLTRIVTAAASEA